MEATWKRAVDRDMRSGHGAGARSESAVPICDDIFGSVCSAFLGTVYITMFLTISVKTYVFMS